MQAKLARENVNRHDIAAPLHLNDQASPSRWSTLLDLFHGSFHQELRDVIYQFLTRQPEWSPPAFAPAISAIQLQAAHTLATGLNFFFPSPREQFTFLHNSLHHLLTSYDVDHQQSSTTQPTIISPASKSRLQIERQSVDLWLSKFLSLNSSLSLLTWRDSTRLLANTKYGSAFACYTPASTKEALALIQQLIALCVRDAHITLTSSEAIIALDSPALRLLQLLLEHILAYFNTSAGLLGGAVIEERKVGDKEKEKKKKKDEVLRRGQEQRQARDSGDRARNPEEQNEDAKDDDEKIKPEEVTAAFEHGKKIIMMKEAGAVLLAVFKEVLAGSHALLREAYTCLDQAGDGGERDQTRMGERVFFVEQVLQRSLVGTVVQRLLTAVPLMSRALSQLQLRDFSTPANSASSFESSVVYRSTSHN